MLLLLLRVYPRADIGVSRVLPDPRREMCHYKIPRITLFPSRCSRVSTPWVLDRGPLKKNGEEKRKNQPLLRKRRDVSEGKRNEKYIHVCTNFTSQTHEQRRTGTETQKKRSRRLPPYDESEESVVLSTTATARLTSEISSASNSTQRPPIVPTPTARTGGGSALTLTHTYRHTHTHTYTAANSTQVE